MIHLGTKMSFIKINKYKAILKHSNKVVQSKSVTSINLLQIGIYMNV